MASFRLLKKGRQYKIRTHEIAKGNLTKMLLFLLVVPFKQNNVLYNTYGILKDLGKFIGDVPMPNKLPKAVPRKL